MRGKRRVPYAEFHTGYKRNLLAPDELVYAVHVPRRFSKHKQYLRKVGTRRAMAISKVALAATALIDNSVVQEIRIAAASLAAFPARLFERKRPCAGTGLQSRPIKAARSALLEEAHPSMTSGRRRNIASRSQPICSRSFLPVSNRKEQRVEPGSGRVESTPMTQRPARRCWPVALRPAGRMGWSQCGRSRASQR